MEIYFDMKVSSAGEGNVEHIKNECEVLIVFLRLDFLRDGDLN